MRQKTNLLNTGFLKDLVLADPGKSPYQSEKEILSLLRRETVEKPTFFIGTSSCGLVAGAGKTKNAIINYLENNHIDADIIEVGCLGLCSEEPILEVQMPAKPRIAFARVTHLDVVSILTSVLSYSLPPSNWIGQYRGDGKEPWEGVRFLDEHPFFKQQQRIVLKHCGVIDPGNILEYIAAGGYKTFIKTLRNYTPSDVCEIIEKSGLRGRGGKGFPTGKKWKSAYDAVSDQKYLICNADESDPGAFMNRALIEGNPHLVIEGIAIAAYAIGASKAYIRMRTEFFNAKNKLEIALEQARNLGLTGNNILGSGVNLEIILKSGPGAFVCGEESALISSLEGKRAMPRPKPPYPTTAGLFDKPTVVNNVETLANIPIIMRNGPQWFASIGSAKSPGTKVFAISGIATHTCLVEVPLGTTLRKIVFDIAAGPSQGKTFKALHLGGPSGNCLPDQMLDIPIDYESLQEKGILMGSGGMIVMDESTCMVDLAKYFIHFMKNESCGKCIPCREGTRRMSEILDNITRRPTKETGHDTLERFKGVMQLESLANVMKSTSLCGLGKSASNPVISTLHWFRNEYEEHVFDRICRAGQCHDLRVFYINVLKCTGCSICEKKCPVDAIVGTPQNPYFIIEEKCTGCGICFDACKFSAVYSK